MTRHKGRGGLWLRRRCGGLAVGRSGWLWSWSGFFRDWSGLWVVGVVLSRRGCYVMSRPYKGGRNITSGHLASCGKLFPAVSCHKLRQHPRRSHGDTFTARRGFKYSATCSGVPRRISPPRLAWRGVD